MSSTVGAASAIAFPNLSGGARKNGGMKYRNARKPHVATTTIPAGRGTIFDRTGVDYSPELTLFRPKEGGCQACGGSGFKGRMGVHELLVGTDDVKRAVQRRAPIDELRKIAQDQGMRTLLQDALDSCSGCAGRRWP